MKVWRQLESRGKVNDKERDMQAKKNKSDGEVETMQGFDATT